MAVAWNVSNRLTASGSSTWSACDFGANAASLESDWEPYFALDVGPETGAFTDALYEDRTRLLRAWRDDAAGKQGTGELKLEPSTEF